MTVDAVDCHAERVEHGGVEYLKAPPELSWPGVALAAAEMALLVGALLVVFTGRVVLVAAAVAGLVAVGGLRVRRVDDEVVLAFDLLVFQSATALHGPRWRSIGPDGTGAGVREPRRPLGPGPASARVELEAPSR